MVIPIRLYLSIKCMINNRKCNIKRFKVVEKNLSDRLKEKRKNEIMLYNSDFKDGRLSFAGYNRLKQECEYIDYSENIEIVIPKEYMDDFKETLENWIANEAVHFKKSIREIHIYSIIFLLIGALWFTLGSIFTIPAVMREVTIVATWVFVWTAVEKWFFEGDKLRKRKYNLYQILLAKLTVHGNKISN